MHLIYFLFTLVGAILVLRWQYPEKMGDSGQWLPILYSLLWLLILGSSMRIQRLDTSTTVKYAAVWLVIIAGLALFYDLLKAFQ